MFDTSPPPTGRYVGAVAFVVAVIAFRHRQAGNYVPGGITEKFDALLIVGGLAVCVLGFCWPQALGLGDGPADPPRPGRRPAADPGDLSRAILCYDRGQYPEALRLADAVLAGAPDAAAVWRFRGECLTQLDQPAEAERSYRTADRLADVSR